jgi:hypothetical protein
LHQSNVTRLSWIDIRLGARQMVVLGELLEQLKAVPLDGSLERLEKKKEYEVDLKIIKLFYPVVVRSMFAQ